MHGPFLFDDDYLPFRNPNFSDNWKVWVLGVRPLLMLTYWVNRSVSGIDTFSYHLFNVAFHLTAGILLFAVLRRLLERAATPRPRRDIMAVAAAAIFLLHPVQTESVAYVASRSENLSVTLFFAAFTVFLYRRRQAVSWTVTAAVLLLGALAITSKEHTLMLPALLLLTDYFWNPGFSAEGIRRNWRLYATVAVGGIAGLYFIRRQIFAGGGAGFGLKDLTWYQYFFTECRALWIYPRLLLFPAGQTIDYDFPISHNLLEHGAWLGLAALIAATAAAWHWRRKYPLASYGWFTFLLLMAPTSSIIPIKDPVAERRLYLSMIGLLLIAAEGLRRLRVDDRKLAAALAGVLVVAGALTYERNGIWGDRIALWQDAVSKAPRKARPRFQLAFAYFDVGRCADAVAQYQVVSRLQPPDYGLLIDWGLACDCAGQPDQAMAKIRAAAALTNSAHAWSLIGMLYAKQSKWDQALDALATAEKINPGWATTYVYRGDVHRARNEMSAAVDDYRKALSLEPNNALAQQGLAAAASRLRSAL
jgi:tetratricopeptide (TPR) repeat protein